MDTLELANCQKLKAFPVGITFKYNWREYQKRVLEELNSHLTDKHLHVIAPPGSGKTVLGLEVALRLNKPTLILAPTIAIRNQWIQRFCELFLQTDSIPDWISKDVRNPAFMTVITYQGLHAACSNVSKVITDETDEEEDLIQDDSEQLNNEKLDQIITNLQQIGIATIVVDEAHHLKNAWWKSLIKVKEALDPVVVGLTATPPYDVTASEWQRYVQLNGPVDTEITIPELVKAGDLCPHQDYIYFTLPSLHERECISDFRQRISDLFIEIKTDAELVTAIAQSDFWAQPEQVLDHIYAQPSYYSACLIFLKANDFEITKAHLEIIGDKHQSIPAFDYEWAETLLSFYLFQGKEYFTQHNEHRKKLESKVRHAGALEKRKISFTNNQSTTGLLTSSISKLNGIQSIVDFEYTQLGHDLRLVVLSDYIRKEFLTSSSEKQLELNKLGVIPIFEQLRRNNNKNMKIGVLTGTTVIIPACALPNFKSKLKGIGINRVNISPLHYDEAYIIINPSDQLKHELVHIITQIFQEGEIEVLIGTKALLGEGWDAPAINSLILASFVGSFVLSNQMRGRAIRTHSKDPNKTGNIWHLCCIDPTTYSWGNDFENMCRRFKSFTGVIQNGEATIENGISRINLPNKFDEAVILEQNIKTFKLASDRNLLKEKWYEALDKGKNLTEEIKLPFPKDKNYQEEKSLYFNKTISNLIVTLTNSVLLYTLDAFQILGRMGSSLQGLEGLSIVFGIILCIGVLFFGGHTVKALRLYLKYRDISKDISGIAHALLYSFIKMGIIKSSDTLKIESFIDKQGAVYCYLDGADYYEKSIFMNALQEILNPVNNPRYLIVRSSSNNFFFGKEDYHAIPEIIGKSKKQAEYFAYLWESYVGSCKLIYTRTIIGRKELLKARVKSLSAQFRDPAEQISKWM